MGHGFLLFRQTQNTDVGFNYYPLDNYYCLHSVCMEIIMRKMQTMELNVPFQKISTALLRCQMVDIWWSMITWRETQQIQQLLSKLKTVHCQPSSLEQLENLWPSTTADFSDTYHKSKSYANPKNRTGAKGKHVLFDFGTLWTQPSSCINNILEASRRG